MEKTNYFSKEDLLMFMGFFLEECKLKIKDSNAVLE